MFGRDDKRCSGIARSCFEGGAHNSTQVMTKAFCAQARVAVSQRNVPDQEWESVIEDIKGSNYPEPEDAT